LHEGKECRGSPGGRCGMNITVHHVAGMGALVASMTQRGEDSRVPPECNLCLATPSYRLTPKAIDLRIRIGSLRHSEYGG
jgi:hypothetical protein